MASSVLLRTRTLASATPRTRTAPSPSANLCGPRRFVRIQRRPDAVRKQADSCVRQSEPLQVAGSLRRDALLPLLPFGAFGPLARYFHELQDDFESLVGADLIKETDVFNNLAGDGAWRLSADITETDAAYALRVDVPGIAKEDIKLKVTDERLLVLTAERKSESDEESKEGVIRKERRFGKFTRSMRLPKNVDISGIAAEAKDGVMTVTLPKVQEEQPTEQEIAVN